jgi:hypothetical protein
VWIWHVVALAFLLVWMPAWAAHAQTPEPRLALKGSVSGDLQRGSRATFTLRATVPGGWRNLHQLKVTMLLHGILQAETTYTEELNTISVRGSQLVRIGTPQVLQGSFFQISGLDVTTSTGGDVFTLTYRARVRQNIPDGTEFRLTAIDDSGAERSIVRRINVSPEEARGFGWGVIILAVAAALFIGGFVGNTFASHRGRSEPKPSIYQILERRIEEERALPPRVPTRDGEGR